jgi:hypothetical protein
VQELDAISTGWARALRTAQIREEARTLAEQLAEANRRLQNAQNEILRSKTMITVGEMAAGAAHEMNNPLAVISGRSQLLAQQLTDPKQKAAAHLVFEQSHRLADIISELMDFAKPVPPAPVETDLADLIGGDPNRYGGILPAEAMASLKQAARLPPPGRMLRRCAVNELCRKRCGLISTGAAAVQRKFAEFGERRPVNPGPAGRSSAPTRWSWSWRPASR